MKNIDSTSKTHRITVMNYDPQDPDGTKPICMQCGQRIYKKLGGNGWTHNPGTFR